MISTKSKSDSPDRRLRRRCCEPITSVRNALQWTLRRSGSGRIATQTHARDCPYRSRAPIRRRAFGATMSGAARRRRGTEPTVGRAAGVWTPGKTDAARVLNVVMFLRGVVGTGTTAPVTSTHQTLSFDDRRSTPTQSKTLYYFLAQYRRRRRRRR